MWGLLSVASASGKECRPCVRGLVKGRKWSRLLHAERVELRGRVGPVVRRWRVRLTSVGPAYVDWSRFGMVCIPAVVLICPEAEVAEELGQGGGLVVGVEAAGVGEHPGVAAPEWLLL
ncbi:hypothetical protein BH10PLA2_BH10PLA2_36170 [soil metagenome]